MPEYLLLELIIAIKQLNINILNSQKLNTIRDQTFFKKNETPTNDNRSRGAGGVFDYPAVGFSI